MKLLMKLIQLFNTEMMASVKYKGRWYESTSLPLELKVKLGLDKEVLADLSDVQPGTKKAPCKKAKKAKVSKVIEEGE